MMLQKLKDKSHSWKQGPHYKWVALSNTTLGILIATINGSIVIISLPAIFNGIQLDPLGPGNINYLLWMLMGYLVCTAVLVVTFGKLGDMYGRTKMYNLGFAVFTLAAIALSFTPGTGGGAALYMILVRVIQGIGGALLMANSTAILADAFPANQRGLALGINSIAGIAGSFIGLIVGGVLADVDWRLIFWVIVPFGVIGTIWAYLMLHESAELKKVRIDWLGNITFAIGLILLLVGINYGIQPYGDQLMGWLSPQVLAYIGIGIVLLITFIFIEARVKDPMFDLKLFRNRAFSLGNLASLLSSIGRGGLQFMLIIWLQGIWLPLHGYSYESTPLWAGIFMVPLTIGFLIAGPVAGYLSDKYGAKVFAAVGMLIGAASYILLLMLPVDFPYWAFAIVIFINGLGSGLFVSPNSAAIMNSIVAGQRGQASGVRATTTNAGMVISIGVFFSLMIVGLNSSLPSTLSAGLEKEGVPTAVAQKIADEPPVGSLFAAFLGYNPMAKLVPPDVLHALPKASQDTITGKEFFPDLISKPFMDGLTIAFGFSAVIYTLGAIASWYATNPRKFADDSESEQDEAEAIGEATGAYR